MSRVRRATRIAAGERGAVLVTFVLFAPVAILFVAFVIDASNSWLHVRHLQVQADAAALASAQAFQPCSNSAIATTAQQYGGVSGTPLYNVQIGGTPAANIHQLINSQTFYNQASPVDTTVSTASPCTGMMVDVKMTETNLPWYVQVLNSAFNGVPYINAQARVEIRQKTQGHGFLPIALNENTPRTARAYFIDESTGTVLASVPLTDQGANGQGQEIWNNVGSPVAVTINKPNIGVRIALSGDATNTACPPTSQLVNCFDLSGPNTTLVHIQGWSNLLTGSVASPKARSATLQPGSCSDGYFSNTVANCRIGVSAKVDVGPTPNPIGVTVSAVVSGSTPSALSYNLSGPSAGLWTGSAPLAAASGSNQVDLLVKCDKTVKNSVCSGGSTAVTLPDVQRTYSAGVNSGSIQTAAIIENSLSGADSFQVCETGNSACTHNLVVSITTAGSLANAQQYTDPTYTMRFGSGTSASQTGAIACLPGGQGGFKTNLINGCSGSYATNPEGAGWACPDTASPQDCVQTDNGFKTGQLRQGMTTRITTPTNGSKYYCSNNWINNNGNGVPNLPDDDSRIIQAFVTSYGSFGGSGNQWYPIQTFATFYVTGWDGDPCQGDPGPPDGGNGKDEIWGHFIKYVDAFDSTGGGTQTCDPNALGECVAVLTR